MVSGKKIFHVNMWPRGGAIFGPKGIIWTNMVEVHLIMLHTKYKGFRPKGFSEEDFFHVFPI